MNKISVFGATGFIGSRFCELYPDDVIKIPRDQYEPESGTVLYLISTTHNYNTIDVDVETNLNVLGKVLFNCKDVTEFYFVSSWFVENPNGHYSFTKYLAEKLVVHYCTFYEIPHKILRLANVFGSGDKFNEKKNALQYLIDKMSKDEDIELYYRGKFYRNYIHVDKVCNALWNVIYMGIIENDFPILNIGSESSVVFRDLIDLAHIVLKSKSQIFDKEEIPDLHKKVQIKDYHMDVTDLDQSFKCFYRTEEVYKDLIRMIINDYC